MDKGKNYSPKGAGLIILGFIVFYFIGFIYRQFIFDQITTMVGYWTEWCIRYAVIFILGVPILVFVTKGIQSTELNSKHRIGPKNFFKYLIVSLGLMNFGGLLGKLLLLLLSGTPFTTPSPYFQGGSGIGAILFLGIIPPIAEEIFFRKILLQKLNAYGIRVAIFGSALLFFIYHTNITAFEPHVFFLGLAFAYIMLRTNNIVYPILIHSMINLFSAFSLRIAPGLPAPLFLASNLITLMIPISFIIVMIKNRRYIIPTIKKLLGNQDIEPLQKAG